MVISVSAQEVSAQQDNEQAVQLLAKSCTSCHGALRGNAIPTLYGRRASRLEKYLLSYKAGARKGTLMPRIVSGYTDKQLTQLALYFASTGVPTTSPSTTR